MANMQIGVVLLSIILHILTADGFFIRSRLPHLSEHGRYEVDIIEDGKLQAYAKILMELFNLDHDVISTGSLQGLSRTRKRQVNIEEESGVVFPWNEWKCQVRGCRKRN